MPYEPLVTSLPAFISDAAALRRRRQWLGDLPAEARCS